MIISNTAAPTNPPMSAIKFTSSPPSEAPVYNTCDIITTCKAIFWRLRPHSGCVCWFWCNIFCFFLFLGGGGWLWASSGTKENCCGYFSQKAQIWSSIWIRIYPERIWMCDIRTNICFSWPYIPITATSSAAVTLKAVVKFFASLSSSGLSSFRLLTYKGSIQNAWHVSMD